MRDKTSYAKSGKIGGLKSAQRFQKQGLENKMRYDNSPNYCTGCQLKLDYTHRNNKFCSNSCAASTNNRLRGIKSKVSCQFCAKPTKNPKYCSTQCQANKRKADKHEEIRSGLFRNTWSGSKPLKRFLIVERGHKCEQCLNTNWQGKEIPLNVHHEDGDASNNLPSNLRLLCLNCHGLTENFGKKNKKSSRSYRYKAP